MFAKAADMAWEKYGLTPVFLSINHDRDGEAAALAVEQMTAPRHLLREPLGTALTIGMISRMQAVISIRLHGLIFASGQGVPIFGVAYDPKVNSFLDYIGEDNYCSFRDLTAQTLIDGVEAALNAPDRARLTEKAARLAALAQINVDCARRLLEDEDL